MSDKYGIKPYNPAVMQYQTATADAAGTPMYLPPDQERMVRDMIHSYAAQRMPSNGIVFVPEQQYNQIRQQIQSGNLFGKRIQQVSEENWGGGDRLGDGFSIPQAERIYLNNALLAHPKQLESTMAHELGHVAAWHADLNRPNFTEEEADRYRNAYMDRRNQYIKLFQTLSKQPLMHRPMPMVPNLNAFQPQ